jgi:hypothetical protein
MLSPRLSTADELALAEEILAPHPSVLSPKPETRLAYGVLLLALPITALGSALLAKRLGFKNTLSLLDLGLLSIGFVGCVLVLARDPILPSLTTTKLETFLAVVVGGIVAAISLCISTRAEKSTRTAATVIICLVGITLTFATRIYDYTYVAAESPHLGAYLYSVNQIFLGGTCLADVVTQYGCYGELYKPIFSMLGLNVYKLTAVNATLQSIALVAIYLFSASLVKRPISLIAIGIWTFVCLNRIEPEFYDPYFQYTPLRIFFPALSLICAVWWCNGPSAAKAGLYGVFSALAVFNNLDSGAVVAVALGVLILMTGLNRTQVDWRQIAAWAALYTLVLIWTLIAIQAWLSQRAGTAVDLTLLGLYTKIFAGSGFMMLPTPAPPSSWTVALLVVIVSASFTSTRVVGRGISKQESLLAYVTILGVGLFSYYLGRSHMFVLVLCIWPLLITAISLLDRMSVPCGPSWRINHIFSLVAVGFLLAIACMSVSRSVPSMVTMAATRWQQSSEPNLKSPIVTDIEFIRRSVLPGDSFEVLAAHQATIYTELGKKSDIPGPGIAEVLLKRDADRLINTLVERGPRNLFIGTELLERQPALMNTSEWLPASIPALRQSYSLRSWSPSSRLMHLVRKPINGPDLFDFEPNCATAPDKGATVCYKYDEASGLLVGSRGRRLPLPFDISQADSFPAFKLGIVVTPNKAQQAYATIVSSHCCSYQGFVIHALPNKNTYVLVVGDGQRWIESKHFQLKDEELNQISISYDNEELTLSLDGKEISHRHIKIAPSSVGITIGDWFNRSRAFSGKIEEVWYTVANRT